MEAAILLNGRNANLVVVCSSDGLMVGVITKTAAGGVRPYERVAPHIREMLEKNAWAHAAKAFVADLIAAAEITGVNFGVPAE